MPSRDQRGLGMLEAMLLLLVVAGALVAGVIALKTRQASIAAEDEMVALTQADRFLASYVAANNRLPCPATSTSAGLEDCGGNAQKGLLPYRTLGLEGTMAAAGVGQLAYEVQRGSVDLAQRAADNNLFEPISFGGERYDARRALGNSGTTADFCQALSLGAAAAVLPSHARVGAPTSGYPVAYALAHGGQRDADGDGRLFDGLNAGTGASMDLPETGAALGTYDDRVVARTYGGLGRMLDCERLMGSLNMMSLAAEVVEEVKSQRDSVLMSAGVLTAVSGVKAVVTIVKIANSAGNMGTATGYMTTASSLLATAIATCVFLVGCAEIPHAAASVAAAAVAIGASAVSIGLNAGAAASTVVAFGLSLAAAIEAGQPQGVALDLSTTVSQLKTAADQTTAERVKAATALSDAQSKLTSAATERDNAVKALKDEAHAVISDVNQAENPDGTRDTTSLDSSFTDVETKAKEWLLAQQNYYKADDALKQAQLTASGTNTNSGAMDKLRADIAAETDPVKKADLEKVLASMVAASSNAGSNADQLQSLTNQVDELNRQIANLDAQIAATTDAEALATLTKTRTDTLAQRDAVNGQLASLSLTVASAQANKTAAQAILNTAATALTNAKNGAAEKFRLMYRPCVRQPITNIETCATNAVPYNDGVSRVKAKLDDLYDAGRGKYIAWWNRNESAVKAQTRYNEALVQEADAIKAYEDMKKVQSGGGSGAGLPNLVWGGSADILKQVDLRGGVR